MPPSHLPRMVQKFVHNARNAGNAFGLPEGPKHLIAA